MEFYLPIFYTLTFIIWTWALADWLRTRFKSLPVKLIWLAVIVTFPVVGSIAYFQFRKRFMEDVVRKFQPAFQREA